jgi:hypothetical protein
MISLLTGLSRHSVYPGSSQEVHQDCFGLVVFVVPQGYLIKTIQL